MNRLRNLTFIILGAVGLADAARIVLAQTNVTAAGNPTGDTRNDTCLGAGYEFYAP